MKSSECGGKWHWKGDMEPGHTRQKTTKHLLATTPYTHLWDARPALVSRSAWSLKASFSHIQFFVLPKTVFYYELIKSKVCGTLMMEVQSQTGWGGRLNITSSTQTVDNHFLVIAIMGPCEEAVTRAPSFPRVNDRNAPKRLFCLTVKPKTEQPLSRDLWASDFF